jgi:hypothetical protein
MGPIPNLYEYSPIITTFLLVYHSSAVGRQLIMIISWSYGFIKPSRIKAEPLKPVVVCRPKITPIQVSRLSITNELQMFTQCSAYGIGNQLVQLKDSNWSIAKYRPIGLHVSTRTSVIVYACIDRMHCTRVHTCVISASFVYPWPSYIPLGNLLPHNIC